MYADEYGVGNLVDKVKLDVPALSNDFVHFNGLDDVMCRRPVLSPVTSLKQRCHELARHCTRCQQILDVDVVSRLRRVVVRQKCRDDSFFHRIEAFWYSQTRLQAYDKFRIKSNLRLLPP